MDNTLVTQEAIPPELEKLHRRQSNAGIARMLLRLGDLAKGKRLAMESNDKHLIKVRGCAYCVRDRDRRTDREIEKKKIN